MFVCRCIGLILKYSPLLLLFYCEIFTYTVTPFFWPKLETCESPKCVKILLVADPQILGEVDSNWIARWDADRYLSKTFHRALEYTQPDIIIFLGDLMDEGHISSKEQFERDLDRFVEIFRVPGETTPERIYLPGDNDIGGEDDPILPHVVTRFNSIFDPNGEPFTFLNLEFYKVNRMTGMFQEPDVVSNDYTRIALSHIPILRKIHTLSRNIAKKIRPHLIFSAHDHDSLYVTAPIDDAWRKSLELLGKDMGWKKYALNDRVMHEFVVPTCSYRMGTKDMGYGYALIDHSSRTVFYTVLWLPQRLAHLFLYVFMLIALGLLGTAWLLKIFVRTRLLRRLLAVFVEVRVVRREKLEENFINV